MRAEGIKGTCNVRYKIQVKGLCQQNISRVTADENGTSDVGGDELHEDPSSRIRNPTMFEEVGQESSAGKDDGIVAKDGAKDEEEAV